MPYVQVPNVSLMPSNINPLLYHYMYNKYTIVWPLMKAIPAAMYKSSQDLLNGVFSEAIRDSDTRAPMMAVGFC